MGLVTGGIFIVLGVFVLCVATFGIFRFEYALNRIHVAARAEARSNPNLKEECGVSEYEGG